MASSADDAPKEGRESVAEAVPPVRIGIVVGEASGDMLGAALMQALQVHYPNAVFEGIGGPRMLALGFHSFFPQDRLAVMGFVDPLKRLPELLRIRRFLCKHFIASRPDLFVGIDSPDFNLDLALKIRAAGIKTAHYVSPTVWAWRQGRVKKIARAVDLMLTLFPFEKAFYEQHKVPVRFVGHPLADDIPLVTDRAYARSVLGLTDLPSGQKVVALLPGSRGGEVERLAPIFLACARLCLAQMPELTFIIPSANEQRHQQLTDLVQAHGKDLPVRLITGQSHQVMAAADLVLITSGTSTLEAMLLKRPMVIAYSLAPFSYWLASRLVKTEFIGLPNLLAQRLLVPEFIQDRAQPELLAEALLRYLQHPEEARELTQAFTELHHQLRQHASVQAAQALVELIGKDKKSDHALQ